MTSLQFKKELRLHLHLHLYLHLILRSRFRHFHIKLERRQEYLNFGKTEAFLPRIFPYTRKVI
jgi:hypothetical protein